ncbi:MAG: hypothetical protein RLZZ283_174 [Candidatus Parcubacteria bacterium]|jgi:hypothetical protein
MQNEEHKPNPLDRIRVALGSKLVTLKREPCGCIAHKKSPIIGQAKIGRITVSLVGHDRHGRGLIPRSEIDRAFDRTFRK